MFATSRCWAVAALCLVAGCASSPESLVAKCDRAGLPQWGVQICSDALKADNLTPHQQASILSDRGLYLTYLGRHDEAIADFNRSIELNPDMGGTYDRRGFAYRRKKDWEAAIKDLDRAIEMLPDLAEPYYSRGRAHFELGHIDEAMADYDQAIKLDPNYASAYNSRGHTYFTLKQWDLAIPQYKRAIEIDPKTADWHQNLATTYVELKEYQLALKEYDRALELSPENVFIHGQRALPRAYVGDVDGATDDAELFLSRIDQIDGNPDGLNTKALKDKSRFLLGMIQIKRVDYPAALATFDHLIKDNPKMAEAYCLRAAVHRLAGDDARADADLRTAIELDPGINDRMKAWLQS